MLAKEAPGDSTGVKYMFAYSALIHYLPIPIMIVVKWLDTIYDFLSSEQA